MTGWTKNLIIDPKQTKHNKGRERTDEYSDPSMGLQISIPAGGDLPCIAATPMPPMTKRACAGSGGARARPQLARGRRAPYLPRTEWAGFP
jgi:hypothetical protein